MIWNRLHTLAGGKAGEVVPGMGEPVEEFLGSLS